MEGLRRGLARQREETEMQGAATRLQAAQRGWAARRKHPAAGGDVEADAAVEAAAARVAAIRVQAAQRGKAVRQSLETSRVGAVELRQLEVLEVDAAVEAAAARVAATKVAGGNAATRKALHTALKEDAAGQQGVARKAEAAKRVAAARIQATQRKGAAARARKRGGHGARPPKKPTAGEQAELRLQAAGVELGWGKGEGAAVQSP